MRKRYVKSLIFAWSSSYGRALCAAVGNMGFCPIARGDPNATQTYGGDRYRWALLDRDNSYLNISGQFVPRLESAVSVIIRGKALTPSRSRNYDAKTWKPLLNHTGLGSTFGVVERLHQVTQRPPTSVPSSTVCQHYIFLCLNLLKSSVSIFMGDLTRRGSSPYACARRLME